MHAGAFTRLRIAAVVAAGAATLGAGLVLWADAARSGSTDLVELEPDLIVERPDELYLSQNGEHLRLKLSNTIANRGVGPLEITAGEAGDGCNYPGKPQGRHTLQTIYEDSDDPNLPSDTESPDFFLRSEDESQVLPPHEAGCSRFHPKHSHWHFDNFARYRLLSERSGDVVGVSRKVSFCVIDTGRPYPDLPGSPGGSYYPQDPEGLDPKFPTCSGTSVDGLSVGWEDTYTAGLPGQGLGISGISRGTYCLELEADPSSNAQPNGVLLESREANNSREVRLRIRPRKLLLHRLGGECELPA